MDVIVTHENADFDAVASQLAAAKLYPSALPLLPRRLNRNVQDFLTLYGATLPFVSADDFPHNDIERLIVVDSQTVPSLKGISDATRIHFIDHHPFDKALPANATSEGRAVGSTTTILVHQLMQAGVTLNSIEATLLMLGIYEDTGSLTYSGTHLEDFQAATGLFEQGANLDQVFAFLHHPLSPQQSALYQTLLQSARMFEVSGFSILLASARCDAYVEEISTLAHLLRDVFDCHALFVLVQIEQNVQVVARSTSDAIDVGSITAALGGGGHARAAAALVRDASLEEVERRVRSLCQTQIHPTLTAGQIMSRGVRTLTPNVTVGEAEQLMRRYGHEGFPVVDAQGELVGVVTRREIDRAMHHQLASTPISAYMHTGAVAVRPDEPIECARSIMIERGIGQVPVVSDGRVEGIITRTDLIKLWGQPAAVSPAVEEIVARLEASLPKDLNSLLRAAGSVAQKKKYMLYIVGGFVRDLLLGVPNLDIDLVVEGDAIALARAMEKRFGGHIHTHERFGTAKWMLPPPFALPRSAGEGTGMGVKSLDFITARREFYTHPTALPVVERSSIQQDLHRRDFTINTLAICLDEFRFGQLLDFFGGLADLRAGVIRVLHNLSFVEDPTRILRAVRYEQRLGFQLEPRTEELIAGARDLLSRVSGERIADELFLIFAEQTPEKALQRLEQLGALRVIQPALHADGAVAQKFARLRDVFEKPEPLAYLGALTHELPLASALGIAQRLKLSKAQTEFIEQLNRLHQLEERLGASELPPSQVVHLLEAFDDEALSVAAALTENKLVRERIEQYRTQWRAVKPLTDGERLKELGIPRGPLYRKILEALREARLDGAISTQQEEEQMALGIARH